MSELREPDLVGVGRAWQIKAEPTLLDQTATLRAWLVNGPWHLFWSFWLVSVIHLRDIPGVKPANRDFPTAEHEFMIVSLKSPPGVAEVHPDPDDLETLRPLLPIDVRLQFAGLDDERAARIADDAVRAIILHGWSPDSDYRALWKAAITRTVEHAKFGGHPE